MSSQLGTSQTQLLFNKVTWCIYVCPMENSLHCFSEQVCNFLQQLSLNPLTFSPILFFLNICLHVKVSQEIHHGLFDTWHFKFLCILDVKSQLKCMPARCIVDVACLLDSKNKGMVNQIAHFFSELESTGRFGGRKYTTISYCFLVMALGTKI